MEQPMHIVQYIVPIITAITAVIMLMAGGRLLKPAIGLCGALLGAGAGLLLAPSIAIDVSPFVVALIFGVIAAIMAVIIAKFAILLVLGISCAIIAPMITWQVAGFGDGVRFIENVIDAATAPEVDSETTTLTTPEDQSMALLLAPTTAEEIATAVSKLKLDGYMLIHGGIERANAAWTAIPNGSRFMLVGSSLAGLLVGLLIATFMPFFAAALVTSTVGSVLLVEAIRNTAATIWSLDTLSNISPMMLTVTTVCIALAGLGLQMTLFQKRSTAKQVV